MNVFQLVFYASLWWKIYSIPETLAANSTSNDPDKAIQSAKYFSLENDKTKLETDSRGSDVFNNTQDDSFKNCVQKTVEAGDFEVQSNGSLYVPAHGIIYNVTDYVFNTTCGCIIVCATLPDESEDSPEPPEKVEGASNATMESSNTSEMEYSDEFIHCAHTPVEKGDFEILPNGSAYVSRYRMLYNLTDYVHNETGGYIAVCSKIFDFYDDAKYSPLLAKVSIAGTAISAFCILLHIGVFVAFKKLRNLPGYSLVFLCISLLVAYTCMYATQGKEPDTDCTALGIIKAYAFLASFFWMNAMSIDIWRSLRKAINNLRLNSERTMLTRLAIYSTYAWGSPLLIIVTGLIVKDTDMDKEYKLYMETDTCWFRYKQALLVYFALPIFVLLGMNILLFVSSFCMINSNSMNTVENKADLWARFLVCLRLAVVMGLIWIFGILAAATQSHVLTYLNVFCTVLQGVFIFLSFTFTEKMKKECRKALQRRKTSSFPTQLSSTQQSTV